MAVTFTLDQKTVDTEIEKRREAKLAKLHPIFRFLREKPAPDPPPIGSAHRLDSDLGDRAISPHPVTVCARDCDRPNAVPLDGTGTQAAVWWAIASGA